jgi:hypothetical protein
MQYRRLLIGGDTMTKLCLALSITFALAVGTMTAVIIQPTRS